MILKLLSFSRYPEFIRLAYWRTIVVWRVKKLGINLQKAKTFLKISQYFKYANRHKN